jgi:hypothetical protein
MAETLGSFQARISKTPLGAGVDAEVLLGMINDRIEVICRSRQWSRLKHTDTIQTVAQYRTGTIDIAVGATSGTGTGTTFTTAMTGRRIRIANLLEYYIFTYVSPTAFTIDRAYEADDDADDVAYTIFQPVYAMPPDLAEVTSLINPTLGIEMQEVDRSYINRNAASRLAIEPPRVYAPFEDSSGGLTRIELYPAPGESVGLPLEYMALPPLFDAEDPDTEATFPDWISIPCLRAGVEADLYDLHNDPSGKQRKEMDFERFLMGMASEDARRSPAIETNMANRYTQHRAMRTMRGRGRAGLRNWRAAD